MALIIPQAQRKVTSEPLPGVRQDIRGVQGAFGGQEAKAITELGSAIGDVGTQLAKREVADAKLQTARDKEAAALQERKDKMYANSSKLEYQQKYADDSEQFLGETRLSADGVSAKYKEWHAKAQDDILSRATTEREKELIRADLDTEFTKNYVKTVDHENTQLQLAETELNDSLYTNAVVSVGLPDSNQIDILDAELTAREALDEKSKGMDAQTAKKVKAEGMSTFHESVVTGKIVSNLEFAKSYFSETKADINPKEREVLRLALREATVTQTAQNIADKISVTQEDRLTWDSHVAVLTKDKEIQDAAKEILGAKKKDADAHDAELVKRDYLEGLDNVLNAKNLEDGTMKANMIVNPSDRLKAIKVANSIYDRKNRDVETDMTVYAQTLDRIRKGEFDTATELLEFYPDMSNTDYQKLVTALGSYQKEQKTGKGTEGVIKIATAKEAFSLAQGVKYDVEAEEQNKLFSESYDKLVDQGITDFDTATKFMRNIQLEKGTLPSSRNFWGMEETMTKAEAKEQNVFDKWLPVITDDAQRKEVRDIFKKSGYLVDDDILIRLFIKEDYMKETLSKEESAIYDNLLKRSGRFISVGNGE